MSLIIPSFFCIQEKQSLSFVILCNSVSKEDIFHTCCFFKDFLFLSKDILLHLTSTFACVLEFLSCVGDNPIVRLLLSSEQYPENDRLCR